MNELYAFICIHVLKLNLSKPYYQTKKEKSTNEFRNKS